MTSDRSSLFFFFSSRRRHTRLQGDWSSDVCSSDLAERALDALLATVEARARELEAKARELADRQTAQHDDAARLERRGGGGGARGRGGGGRAPPPPRGARGEAPAHPLPAGHKGGEAPGRARGG